MKTHQVNGSGVEGSTLIKLTIPSELMLAGDCFFVVVRFWIYFIFSNSFAVQGSMRWRVRSLIFLTWLGVTGSLKLPHDLLRKVSVSAIC